MKKFIALFTLAVSLGGCGQMVTIQSAEVAKQLGGDGFETEVRQTGITRLDACIFAKICPSIVKMSIGRNTNQIEIDSIYLPKSNVDVQKVRVGVQWRPRNNEKSINTIYNELYSDPTDSSSIRVILTERIWKNYGERIIPARIVDVLKDVTVDQAMNTSSELSSMVKAAVDQALKDSPIEVTQLDVINTDVPDQVMKAKYNLFAIEDDKNRQIKQLETGRAIESQRQSLQVTRANNDKAIAISLGMTPAQYICLKTAEKMADAADNKGAAIFVNGNCGLGGNSENTVVPMKSKENTQ